MSNIHEQSLPGASRRDPNTDNPDLRPLAIFAAIAVPLGWVLLSIPIVTGLAVEPFVLATLLFGLVIPAVLLTRNDESASMRALLGDCVRVRGVWLLGVVALLLIPVATWVVASGLDAEKELTGSLLLGLAINIVSSLLIINLWEEMAWAGFFQRRAMARWGFVRGSLVTAALFAGVHIPLAFAEADGARDVLIGFAALAFSGIGLRLLIGALDGWGRSILVVAILHAAFNGTAELIDSDHDWIRYAVTFVAGLIAAAIFVRRVAK